MINYLLNMPTPEQIRSARIYLPTVELSASENPRNYKIWEGTEKGGHFHFFKRTESLYSPEIQEGFEVCISGSKQSRTNLARDFVYVLGEPTHVKEKQNKTFFMWLWSMK